MVSWFQLTLNLKVLGELQLTIQGLTQLTTKHRDQFFKPLLSIMEGNCKEQFDFWQ